MRLLIASTLLLTTVATLSFAQPMQSAAPSPAQAAIAQAQIDIAAHPDSAESYAALAFALARRARETADATFYAEGESAVRKSLELAPNNFTALKAKTWLLLGKHEFAAARDAAEALNQRQPDDLQVYGFLTDAYAELGDYEAAEKACDWMLKLRPGNIPALTRAAYLREIFGDLDGAVDLMTQALEATPLALFEDRAWLLTQLAHLELLQDRPEKAETLLAAALEVFPDYHYALAGLARTRIRQGRYAEATDLFRRRYDAAPHPENLFDLADALKRAGRDDEATSAFEDFEAKAVAESAKWDNANRELIAYYANHAAKPETALQIAELEFARRKDVYTRDAYAWALHVNGRHQEAITQADAIAAIGLRDPKVTSRINAIRDAGEKNSKT